MNIKIKLEPKLKLDFTEEIRLLKEAARNEITLATGQNPVKTVDELFFGEERTIDEFIPST
jgi:hypothetical protein